MSLNNGFVVDFSKANSYSASIEIFRTRCSFIVMHCDKFNFTLFFLQLVSEWINPKMAFLKVKSRPISALIKIKIVFVWQELVLSYEPQSPNIESEIMCILNKNAFQ